MDGRAPVSLPPPSSSTGMVRTSSSCAPPLESFSSSNVTVGCKRPASSNASTTLPSAAGGEGATEILLTTYGGQRRRPFVRNRNVLITVPSENIEEEDDCRSGDKSHEGVTTMRKAMCTSYDRNSHTCSVSLLVQKRNNVNTFLEEIRQVLHIQPDQRLRLLEVMNDRIYDILKPSDNVSSIMRSRFSELSGYNHYVSATAKCKTVLELIDDEEYEYIEVKWRAWEQKCTEIKNSGAPDTNILLKAHVKERPLDWCRVQVVLFSSDSTASRQRRPMHDSHKQDAGWEIDIVPDVEIHGLPHMTYITQSCTLDSVRCRIQQRLSPAVNLAECRAAFIDHQKEASFLGPGYDSAYKLNQESSSSPSVNNKTESNDTLASSPSIATPIGDEQDVTMIGANEKSAVEKVNDELSFHQRVLFLFDRHRQRCSRSDAMKLVMIGFELKGKIVAPKAKRRRRAEGGISIRC